MIKDIDLFFFCDLKYKKTDKIHTQKFKFIDVKKLNQLQRKFIDVIIIHSNLRKYKENLQNVD